MQLLHLDAGGMEAARAHGKSADQLGDYSYAANPSDPNNYQNQLQGVVWVTYDGSASSDTDSDSLSYSWSFGDGGSATGASASHTYSAAGSYTATLTVSDGQASITVQVKSPRPTTAACSVAAILPVMIGAAVLRAPCASSITIARW